MVDIGGVVKCSHYWTLVLAGTGKLWMVIFWFRVVLLAGGEERGEGFLQGISTILYFGSCGPRLWHGATRLKYSRNLGDIKVYYMCFRLPSKDIKRTMEIIAFRADSMGYLWCWLHLTMLGAQYTVVLFC